MKAIEIINILKGLVELWPGLPAPYINSTQVTFYLADEQDIRNVALALGGKWTKGVSDYFFTLFRQEGSVTLRLSVERALVCERKVVGKKHVPGYVVEAHDEDIVEWTCPDSILAVTR